MNMNIVKVFGLALLAGSILVSGCRRVHVFGDSTVNKDAPLVNPNGSTIPGHNVGDTILRVIQFGEPFPSDAKKSQVLSDPNLPLWIAGWEGVSGEMTWSHPLRDRIAQNANDGYPATTLLSAFMAGTIRPDLANRFDVAVFSLGTNDSIHYTLNNGWNAQTAKNRVNFLWKRAVDSGANCIVWVLPSENINSPFFNAQQTTTYNSHMKTLNDHIRSLEGDRVRQGNNFRFSVADWGSYANANNGLLSDLIHPNVDGVIVMGNMVGNKIRNECPDGRYNQ